MVGSELWKSVLDQLRRRRCGRGSLLSCFFVHDVCVMVLVVAFLSQIYSRLLGACTCTLSAQLRVEYVAVPILCGSERCGCTTCVCGVVHTTRGGVVSQLVCGVVTRLLRGV